MSLPTPPGISAGLKLSTNKARYGFRIYFGQGARVFIVSVSQNMFLEKREYGKLKFLLKR